MEQLPSIVDGLVAFVVALAAAAVAFIAAESLDAFGSISSVLEDIGEAFDYNWKGVCDKVGVKVGKGYMGVLDTTYPPHSQQYHELNRSKQEASDVKGKVESTTNSSKADYDPGDPNNKDKNKNKDKSSENVKNPLEKIEYTDKVKQQMKKGDYHSFPESVDAMGGNGKITQIQGGDGIWRTKVEIQGSYMGKWNL